MQAHAAAAMAGATPSSPAPPAIPVQAERQGVGDAVHHPAEHLSLEPHGVDR
jgi:hypothetical protein